ncbi:MAG: hypothetical protein MZV65_41510 [Chromatiales bacterium]|nr:hypothetical protein [Chromatiales bacterium]
MGLVRPAEADAAANVASQVAGVRQVVTLFEYISGLSDGYFTDSSKRRLAFRTARGLDPADGASGVDGGSSPPCSSPKAMPWPFSRA